MTSQSILAQWAISGKRKGSISRTGVRDPALDQPAILLPRFVRQSAVAMRYHSLLSPIHWSALPERDLARNYGRAAVPYGPFVAACLVKLDQHLLHMSDLRQYLVEHPALSQLLSFPMPARIRCPCSARVDACLPTQRHFTRMLRRIPNAYLQVLLDQTVCLLRAELLSKFPEFGQFISLDTKHILAWVKENNPKAYQKRSERFDKTRQPSGDPDCRLGCKRKHNQRTKAETLPTPLKDAVPAKGLQVGDYFWGYGSGLVATKIPGWGEFVLAERTQPFDRSDVSYFFPLMANVQRRLGFRPRFGALDAAFDAWYVYEYFHRDVDPPGFAAVPLVTKGGYQRTFSPDGLPLCKAGLPMPLKLTFMARKGCLVPHQKGRHACPLLFPEPTGERCSIDDPHWEKGGCTTTLATSIGARIRYQIDRDSEAYKHAYKQRTATERINAQATALGIERPKLRNGAAIANLNTLIYVLINLRALQRVRAKKRDESS